MIILGLLIALAAAVFAAVVLAQNWGGATHTIHGFGATLGSLTLAEIFLAGIILTAIFLLALWLAGLSNRMRRRASLRRREQTRSVHEEREGLVADRDRLARELEAERARSQPSYPRGEAAEPYPSQSYPREEAGGVYREAPVYPTDPHDATVAREDYAQGGYRDATDR